MHFIREWANPPKVESKSYPYVGPTRFFSPIDVFIHQGEIYISKVISLCHKTLTVHYSTITDPQSTNMLMVWLVIVVYPFHSSSRISDGYDDNKRYIINGICLMDMPTNISFILQIWIAIIFVICPHRFYDHFPNYFFFRIYSGRKCSQTQTNALYIQPKTFYHYNRKDCMTF